MSASSKHTTMLLNIEHITIYRYNQPVSFGQHRLMLRPMEGHDVQIRASGLEISPAYRLRWMHDVFGNSVAVVDFQEAAPELRISSSLTVEQYNTNPFDFVLDITAHELPFQYALSEAIDIAPYQLRQHPAEESVIHNWVRPFLNVQGRARTLDFLTALCRSVPMSFSYARREEPGVQTPAYTLRQRSGSCRDFALLFMEAARHLGLAARFVSGYLCRTETQTNDVASDATHAWAEIYLPGAGWKGFDPTCGILAADSHVRVAVTRDPVQAAPVSGLFIGPASAAVGMEVIVRTRALPPPG